MSRFTPAYRSSPQEQALANRLRPVGSTMILSVVRNWCR